MKVGYFLKDVVKTFFMVQSQKYRDAANYFLVEYPVDSFGYKRGELLQAVADFYLSLAQALKDESGPNL